MIKQLYENICEDRDVRANLIALRQELKDRAVRRAFAYLLGGEFGQLTQLLHSEDPKIRKNAALILGDMETEDVLPYLYDAYQREETLFVRSDYLKAMAKLDYRPYLERLKDRMVQLQGAEYTEENRKHCREELCQLQNMVLKYEKPRKHRFIGYDPSPEVILVTNKNQKKATGCQITSGTVTELGQGFRVKGGNLKELLSIRTVQELLFPIAGSRPVSGSPEEIGKALARLDIAGYLEDLHKGSGCFYYRIEVKGPMPLDKKGTFIRKVTEILDESSGGRLRNSAAEYEAEIRLLERRDGSFIPMLKLYTIADQRFAYRRESVAASISPVNAALTVRLASPWMKDNAQVLDPFCGVGTMLLERNHAVPAAHMYGVDIFGEAIEKARKNTERDGSIVHYINRDFFEFTHDYLFDEIITDMPRASREGGVQELALLYRRFAGKALCHLKDGAVVILYTMDPDLAEREILTQVEYQKLASFLINEKNGTSVYVLQVHLQPHGRLGDDENKETQ